MKITRRQLRRLISEALTYYPRHVEPSMRMTLLKNELDMSKLSGLKQGVSHKPSGLWYAFGEEWIKFLKENWKERFEGHEYLYSLSVNVTNIAKPNTALVLRLESKADADEFSRRYVKGDDRWSVPDWSAVANDFGGIEIVSEFIGYHAWTDKWDIASGCVWNNDAIINTDKLSTDADVQYKRKGFLEHDSWYSKLGEKISRYNLWGRGRWRNPDIDEVYIKYFDDGWNKIQEYVRNDDHKLFKTDKELSEFVKEYSNKADAVINDLEKSSQEKLLVKKKARLPQWTYDNFDTWLDLLKDEDDIDTALIIKKRVDKKKKPKYTREWFQEKMYEESEYFTNKKARAMFQAGRHASTYKWDGEAWIDRR